MAELKTHFRNLTAERNTNIVLCRKVYEKEVTLEGHKFIHYALGFYVAEEPFILTGEEIVELFMEYKHLVLGYKEKKYVEPWFSRDREYIITFAYHAYDASFTEPIRFSNMMHKLNMNNQCCNELETKYHIHKTLTDNIFSWLSASEQLRFQGYETLRRFQKKFRQAGKEIFTYTCDGMNEYTIKFRGCIGYLIEEGIWYFPLSNEKSWDITKESCYVRPLVDAYHETVDMAILGSTVAEGGSLAIVTGYRVSFLTFDRRYYSRLLEIKSELKKFCFSEFEAEERESVDDGEDETVEKIWEDEENERKKREQETARSSIRWMEAEGDDDAVMADIEEEDEPAAMTDIEGENEPAAMAGIEEEDDSVAMAGIEGEDEPAAMTSIEERDEEAQDEAEHTPTEATEEVQGGEKTAILDQNEINEILLSISGSDPEEDVSQKESSEDRMERCIDENAEELVAGLGIKDIVLRYDLLWLEKTDWQKYSYAYKLGDDLVLVYFKYNVGIVKEKHSLKLLSELRVKEYREIAEGLAYPIMYTLIDAGDCKLEEVLTEEAYKLLQEETEKI